MRRRLAPLALALAWPATAHAHLVNTGLGPVYDGVSHLFVSFDDLLPALAMAMLAGLNGPSAGRRVLFALPAAWLLAGFAGHAAGAGVPVPGITSVSLLVFGILAAADVRLGPGAVTALAVVLGSTHGWLNGASLAADGREASSLVGIGGAIFVLAALLGSAVVALRPPWTRVAVRAAASWIAAIGLLHLGWTLGGRT